VVPEDLDPTDSLDHSSSTTRRSEKSNRPSVDDISTEKLLTHLSFVILSLWTLERRLVLVYFS
jgi:hypothetical protein